MASMRSAKYADVVSADDALEIVEGLDADMYNLPSGQPVDG